MLLQVAIQSVLEGAAPDVEVVVADNSDVSVEVPDDPRVRVLPRPDRVITMTDNWERALAATRGEWITFMSDKHRLVPKLYRRVLDLGKRENLRLATFERAYFYQDLTTAALSVDALWNNQGTLLSPISPGHVETRTARATIAEWFRVIRGAADRPQIYRGIVHRSLIESAMRKTSQFFFGTCPDYASGLQTMSEVDCYLATNLPATVVQIPTTEIGAWSPAASLDEGGKLGNERMLEAGYDAFERHGLPITTTSSILETLLEFRRMRPEACAGIPLDWQRYTWLATHEIESMKTLTSQERRRRHSLVTRVSQRDGIDLRALATQARVLVSRRRPDLAAGYLRLKRLLHLEPAPQPKWSSSWHRGAVKSLRHARVEVERAFLVGEAGGPAGMSTSP